MDAAFEPHQKNDVIRVAAYHRRDFALALIRSGPGENDSVRTLVTQAFPTPPATSIGDLECLPAELLQQICLYLDIRSYFRFRQVNRRARLVVSSVWEYGAVAEHGLESLRAVLRTGIAPHLTIPDLYRPLCRKKCALCDSFGGFLFLPTATRCCFGCIDSANALNIVSLSAFSKAAKISPKRLRRLLPVLLSIPGQYGMWHSTRSRPTNLVSERQAIDTLPTLTKNLDLQEILAQDSCWRFMASTALPFLDLETNEVENGLSCKGCQVAVESSRPRGDESVFDRRDMVYSKDGFLDHFNACVGAKGLWVASQEGRVPFKEPEFTRRRGYLPCDEMKVETSKKRRRS